MPDLPVQTGPAAAEPQRNPWTMLVSVMTEPGAVFAALREKPAWLPPVLVYWLIAVVTGFLAIPKSIDLSLDQVLAKSPGTDVESLRRMITLTSYFAVPISTLVVVVGFSLAGAGILTLLGIMLGGEGSFLQVWSAYLYAGVPASIIGAIIKGAMMLTTPASGIKTLSTSLALILPKESFGSGLYYALSAIDPFSLWRLVLLTIGFAVAMKLTTRKAAFVTVPLWLVVEGIAIAGTAFSLSKLG